MRRVILFRLHFFFRIFYLHTLERYHLLVCIASCLRCTAMYGGARAKENGHSADVKPAVANAALPPVTVDLRSDTVTMPTDEARVAGGWRLETMRRLVVTAVVAACRSCTAAAR